MMKNNNDLKEIFESTFLKKKRGAPDTNDKYNNTIPLKLNFVVDEIDKKILSKYYFLF